MAVITTDEMDVVARMIDFCEENWSAFKQRCEEAGMHEREIEDAIRMLKDRE